MDICTIYVIRNTINDKVYVGQTWGDINHRLSRHIREDGCPKIHRAIKKYGSENFSIEPILSALTQEDADAFEKHFIQSLDSIQNGYNLKNGGDGGKHSEETKSKMSKSRKGKKRSIEACRAIAFGKMGDKNPMYGRHHTEEHKRLLSAKMKGTTNVGSFLPGHTDQMGENHAQAKLTNVDVIYIKRLIKDGISCKDIAPLFKVSRGTISNIKFGRTWAHIKID